MEASKVTVFLITGPPGVGKTTLVRKICAKLREHRQLQGFYTEEVRAGGSRVGFDVVTLTGERGILARATPTTDTQRRPKVGKYAVYVDDFEALALPLLKASQLQLLVIDEVGKMELFSKRFETSIHALLQQQQLILATIPQPGRQPIPMVEQLRKLPHACIYQVTKLNRDKLCNEIIECILNITK